MNILVTGAIGFVGFHTTDKLLKKKTKIFGIDNINNYYDRSLKLKRLKILKKYKNFKFKKIDINNPKLRKIIKNKKINFIIHLAAQAGVRYSISNPKKYFDSNLKGFFNIIEIARDLNIPFIYASSSSVYGEQKPMIEEKISKPIQFYAATKKSNEIISDVYSKLYKMKIIGLRFFTVYGDYGRPDMSYFKFANLISREKPIEVYNNFKHSRDFTHVSDVVDCIILAKKKLFNIKKTIGFHEIYNVGTGKVKSVSKLVILLEKYLGKKSKKIFLNKQLGDIQDTFANITKAKQQLNYNPRMSFEKGIKQFCVWFKDYQ